MKIIRISLLLMTLACSVYAGEIDCGVTASGVIPNGVASSGEYPIGGRSAGEIPCGATSSAKPTVTQLTAHLLALLMP